MGYKLELNPEAFARTQQGGCVMTATDTDTNIIEPLILKEGRAGGRTAINRDGILYDVLPYEPAMSLKDGVMVLSEEPLGENKIEDSEDFNALSWSLSNSVATSNSKESPRADITATTFTDNTNNSTHAVNYFNLWSTVDNTVSIYVKKGSTSKIYIGNASGGGGYIYFNLDSETFSADAGFEGTINLAYSGWYRLTATYKTAAGTGTLSIGTYTGVNTRSYIGVGDYLYIWGGQIEEGVKATSYIKTSGGTGVRLGATGVKTPNTSKWINSEEGSLAWTGSRFSKYFNNYISLNDGTTANRMELIFLEENSTLIRVQVVVGGVVTSVFDNSVAASEDVNSFELTWGNGVYKLYNNGVLMTNQGNGDSYSQGVLKYLSLNKGGGGEDFFGGTEYIKIES